MKPFLSENFLLQTKSAERLYHDYAADMPIFDYHCHLPVAEIAENKKFANLTAIWLHGDHYKWRAMRANGVDETYITGSASDKEKFRAWAATVPKTLRNPLYHWTHLELKHPFGITDTLLSPATADTIYEKCSEMLQQENFSTQGLLKQMKVKVVCTTDDPLDSLEHHQKIAADKDCPTRVLPTWRPDRAMATEDPAIFNQWVDRLAACTGRDITSYTDFHESLRERHNFFHEMGCRLSDHGIEEPYAEEYTETEATAIFAKIRSGKQLSQQESLAFKSAMLFEFAVMDHERGWTQQFHFGTLRNNNTRAFTNLGPDTGYDSIGDFTMARSLNRFLDRLDSGDQLSKTILYILNPRDNEMIATLIGNFQDGRIPGKMQFGSGWWFNDQKDGMERQMNALSTMGLLSRFVGMLTDSRSFLSYPRHEYFRRILCNLFGNDIENGELPADFELIGNTVQDICYRNAVNYFGIDPEGE
ncbi:glucuronate isomerase [Desulfopila aestuarii]|uniref:Uronate isomerase n=1 Tax=Desulfopila aestuarii DSM 18488 TaxID=1121416 RepID=A0A1M7YEX8_9BACT|nr:glucuronate isomerase [Desulfopila aestuarii]SHO51163.1 glucuronate isomerase [Desulfopila aestuarii DSM 18488]